jgi:K+-sensing histidine kinase KdpD
MTHHAGEAPARPVWLDHLAHDLRSPLAPLSSAIAVMRAGKLDAAQQAELLATMQRQIDTLAQLVDDTADLLGRRANGSLAPIPLASLLDMAGVRVLRRFEEAGVAFEARLPDDAPSVHCDARSLVRLLAQLALAAAHIGGAGNRVIVTAEPGSEVRLTLALATAVPEAAEQFASLAGRWSNPAPPHVADAAMREILVRHGAHVHAATGDAPGIVLVLAPAGAGD